MKVRLYFNLRKRLFSLQHRTPKGWRLWKHVDNINLHFPEFKVSESGRQRVLRDRRKNVHAYVEGILSAPMCVDHDDLTRVSYDPYKGNAFVIKNSGVAIMNGRYLIGTIDNITRQPSLHVL